MGVVFIYSAIEMISFGLSEEFFGKRPIASICILCTPLEGVEIKLKATSYDFEAQSKII